MFSKKMICLVFLFFLLLGIATPSFAESLQVIDAGSAWPSNVVGVYTADGTYNGKTCYQGPDGYWLYHTQWEGIAGWFIGKPLGQSEINSTDVRFYYFTTAGTPPLNANFSHTNNALGSVKVTTGGGTPPSVPSGISTHPATSSSFTSGWSDVPDATGYKLEVSTAENFSSFVTNYGPFVITIPEGTPFANRPRNHVVSGLSPGTTYYFRMKSFNGFGDSSPSAVSSITTVPAAPVVQPASDISDVAFQANWSSQSGASHYLLYVSLNNDMSSPFVDGQFVSNSHHPVTGLNANTSYYYRVKAVNASGQSGLSSIQQVTTGPSKPSALEPSMIQTNAFTANWAAVPEATAYYLDVATDDSFNNILPSYTAKSVGNVTSHVVDQSLLPHTAYHYRIRSGNALGASSNSNTISVTTAAIFPEVTTDSVTLTSPTTVEMVGTVITEGQPALTQHGFVWNTLPNPTTAHSKVEMGAYSGTTPFTSITDLSYETTYYIRAYAVSDAGTVYGGQLEVTTEPEKIPLTIEVQDADKIYGTADPTFSVSYTGFVGDDTSEDLTGTLIFSREEGESIGLYGVSSAGLSSDKYDIIFQPGNLTILPRPLTVTADSAEKVYGQDDPLFSYHLTSGELVGSDAFTGSLSRDTGEDAGSYLLHLGSLSAGDNYLIHFVDAALTIAPKPLTVTADSAEKIYGQDDPLFSYHLTSGELVGSDAFTGSLSRDTGEDAGSYLLHLGSLSAGDNYLIHFVDAALTIAPKPLTVTADSAEKIYGQDDPLFTVTYTGFVFDDTPVALHGELLFVREPGNDIGTYTITPGGLASSNYEITFVPGTLTISLYHPKLQDLKISQGIMNPAFNPNVTYYQISVAHHISSLTLTPYAINSLEVIHINSQPAVSGQWFRNIPLNPGLNAITISIATADGLHQETYHLAVSRASTAASDSESTSSSSPTSQPQPHSKLIVQLNQALSEEGTARFTAVINAQEVSNVIQTLKANGLSNLMILTEAESGTAASVIDIHVPERTLVELSENNISLEIATAFGSLELPVELLTSLIDQSAPLNITIEKIPPHESVVARQLAAATGNTPLGEDTKFLTNINGRTRVTLSLSGIDMPVDSGERQHLLSSLAVFVYHSDATTEVIEGTIQYDDAGNPVSISIWVNHFSTFVIVKLPEDGIQLFIDSKVAIFNGIEFSLDAAPLIDSKTNRTLVPVRFTSEMLGADVQWFADLKQVHITDSGRQIILTIDSDKVLLNGTEHRLECAATIIDGRMYVPLRFISETLGALVEWNGAAKSIIIKK